MSVTHYGKQRIILGLFMYFFSAFLFILRDGDAGISISSYYWTRNGSVFVGGLVVISMLLFTFKGYNKTETILSKMAAVTILLTALFPVNINGQRDYFLHFLSPELVHTIHYLSAVMCFILFGVIAFSQFFKTSNLKIKVFHCFIGFFILGITVALIPIRLFIPAESELFILLQFILFFLVSQSWIIQGLETILRTAAFKSTHMKRNILYQQIPKEIGTLKPKLIDDLVEIIIPETFSFIENCDETTIFFAELNHISHDHRKIILNLRRIKDITSDALLYLQFEIMKYKAQFNVQENENDNSPISEYMAFPKSEEIASFVQYSGFYEHILPSRRDIHGKNANFFHIDSTDQSEQGIADVTSIYMAADYCENFISDKQIVVNNISAILVELINNIAEHAFLPKKTKRETNHWALSIINKEKENTLSFTLFDNGRTIPATIQKRGITDPRKGIANNWRYIDHKLIESAIKGEQRSNTRKAGRGQGLPFLYDAYNANIIKDLCIISRYGYFRPAKKEFREMWHTFNGTLVAFNVKYK
ncbi:MAG: hypothetical protein ACR2PY_08975 [Salinispira sp.]